MVTIDGSTGEGGGQILRSSIALSMVTGEPVTLRNIRARRKRPGLMRQHLTAVRAAAEISGARVEGGAIGSSELRFSPGSVRPGEYDFSVGTAGSTMLVLQTLLPALALADSPSRLTLEGGTHNPMAPPFPFVEQTFLPVLRQIGPEVSATLERPGFYPAGGGRATFEVRPSAARRALELLERGEIHSRRAIALIANLDDHIAKRELDMVARKLGWRRSELEVRRVESAGPGNVVLLEAYAESVTEVFSAFGAKGIPAPNVALQAIDEYQRWLASGAPVGEHLADQLLLPMALAGGGTFRAVACSRHTATQMELIPRFLDRELRFDAEEGGRGVFSVSA